MPKDLSHADRDAIHEAIVAGKMIEAIKLYREVTDEGLKESKDAVEAMQDELRAAHPERFDGTSPKSKSGCLPMVLLFVGLIFTTWLAA